MATTTNSDVIINNTLAQTAYFERVQDVVDVFNGASQGGLRLVNESIPGDLRKASYYELGGEIAHRDVNSTDAVTAERIGMTEHVGVKTPFRFGPFSATEEAFKRRGRSVEEFSMLVGASYADAEMAGQIRYAVAAVTAAIGSNAAMNVSAAASDGRKLVTKALRPMGDQYGRLKILCMDSATYFDLVDTSIDNKLFTEADQSIYGGTPGTMGLPVLVSDRMAANTILALQPSAVTITVSQAPEFRSYAVNDRENLMINWRAEGAMNIDALGYSYNESAGINPNLATLGAAANWSKVATSNKMTAGVVINIGP